MAPAENPRDRVLLDGWSAEECPVKTRHRFWADATGAQLNAEGLAPVPAYVTARIASSRAYRDRILDEIAAATGNAGALTVRDCRTEADPGQATSAALAAGIDVILGPLLPDDDSGARRGGPDALLRVEGEYRPVAVRGHLNFAHDENPESVVRVSALASPTSITELSGLVHRRSRLRGDLVPLAHAVRMLEAAGIRSAGPVIGGIIGRGEVDGAPVIVWHDLGEAMFPVPLFPVPLFPVPTFPVHPFPAHTRKGEALESALNRHDREHGFRVEVARAAADGRIDPRATPLWVSECESCPWRRACSDELDARRHPSRQMARARLGAKEWLALNAAGFDSVERLAGLDVAALPDSFFDSLPMARDDAAARLGDAVIRAQMALTGEELRRVGDGADVPRAQVELDLDIEWDSEGRVYLWGVLLAWPDEPVEYVHFAAWDDMTEDEERELAERAVGWICEVLGRAEAAGLSSGVYHYADVEAVHIRRILGAIPPILDAALVDLYAYMRRNFIGRHGLSLKRVAPALGFNWRDEDPGGLQSQNWLADSRGSEAAPREKLRSRILAYNEDDVRATRALREGLSVRASTEAGQGGPPSA